MHLQCLIVSQLPELYFPGCFVEMCCLRNGNSIVNIVNSGSINKKEIAILYFCGQ